MIERNSRNNKTGTRRGRVKWMTAGFFSFETTQRAICQIVGQWILFRRNSQCCQPSHKIRNPLSILQEWQNAVSWNELVKISSKLAKFVKRLMLSFAICCQGIRTRLSRFSTGKKIQRKVLWADKTTKCLSKFEIQFFSFSLYAPGFNKNSGSREFSFLPRKMRFLLNFP